MLEISNDTALKVNHVSKSYRMRGDNCKGGVAIKPDEAFHALKDVSFEIKKGEICGLVGRNGAGKTTLLELISGIIKPTAGEIIINGVTASVIDVGTGMHRDLSGLENIFLAGELLGMSKNEISKKLPEIISFSELQKFLHLPVKHYSSGMFMRLAFSVITHLDADMLLIDEVIGVGDMAFSEKTTAKIMEVCKQGKSAIITTHSLPLISACCSTAMYLKNGVLASKDETDIVLEHYVEDVLENNHDFSNDSKQIKPFKPKLANNFDGSRANHSKIKLTQCSVRVTGHSQTEFSVEDDLLLEFFVEVKSEQDFIMSVHINHQYNRPAICLVPEIFKPDKPDGRYHFQTTLHANILNQGIYTISIYFVDVRDKLIGSFENVLIFKTKITSNTKAMFGYSGKFSGPVFIGGNWTVDKI